MNTGIFGEGFPYSNFHDLNMDWIIKIAKDFLDQYTHIQDIIAQGLTDIENKTNDGLEELQNTYTTLDNLLNQWYETHSADIANQLALALADLNAWYTTHSNYLDQELADNILAFTQSANSKTAESIASIPSDYSELSSLATQLKTGLFSLSEHNYLIGETVDESYSENGVILDYVRGTWYVHGTSTGNCIKNIFSNQSALPWGMSAGVGYTARATGIINAVLEIFAYNSGSWEQICVINNNTTRRDFTIPSTATGLLVRINCSGTGITYNERWYPIISNRNEYTNKELYDFISADENTLDSITEGTVIPTNSDLDDYQTTGLFLLADGRVIAHKPENLTTGFLQVYKMSPTGIVLQIATNISTDYFYMRRLTTGWNEWQKYKRNGSTFYTLKIAMFGDSIIWGRDGGNTEGVYQVAQTIPKIVEATSNRFETTNFGVGSVGWLSTQYSNTRAIDIIMQQDLTNYDVVTYMFGSNDTQENLGSYTDTGNDTIMGRIYNAMNYVKTNYPNITQILIGVPNSTHFKNTEYGGFPHYDWTLNMYNGKTKDDVDKEMQKFAEYYHINYISLKDTPISSFNITSLIPDDVHPNTLGYKALGGYIKGQLESILGS